jgi:hypothetical protein
MLIDIKTHAGGKIIELESLLADRIISALEFDAHPKLSKCAYEELLEEGKIQRYPHKIYALIVRSFSSLDLAIELFALNLNRCLKEDALPMEKPMIVWRQPITFEREGNGVKIWCRCFVAPKEALNDYK